MVKILTTARFPVNRRELVEVVSALLQKKSFDSAALINIIFVGTRKMREVANTYKQEDVALPVLSFSYLNETDPKPLHESEKHELPIGEVLICYPQAVLLAAQRNRPVDKVMTELVEHGVKNIIMS